MVNVLGSQWLKFSRTREPYPGYAPEKFSAWPLGKSRSTCMVLPTCTCNCQIQVYYTGTDLGTSYR
jgi:hypothetical protein